MYFISYKCVVGEVGSYCQLAVTFFFFFLVSPYQTRDSVVPQFIFDPPFYKSGSAPVRVGYSILLQGLSMKIIPAIHRFSAHYSKRFA